MSSDCPTLDVYVYGVIRLTCFPLTVLFFAKPKEDLEASLKELRVDRPADWDEPKSSPQLPKMPWQK
jgi:hypothetical protein